VRRIKRKDEGGRIGPPFVFSRRQYFAVTFVRASAISISGIV
jgi:hypothetical protein